MIDCIVCFSNVYYSLVKVILFEMSRLVERTAALHMYYTHTMQYIDDTVTYRKSGVLPHA